MEYSIIVFVFSVFSDLTVASDDNKPSTELLKDSISIFKCAIIVFNF